MTITAFGIGLASRHRIDLARHFDTASRLSPKSAAVASRLLVRARALLTPEAGSALHAFLQDQATKSEELSSSDLMVLLTHGTPPPERGFIFETANHRMARVWIEGVMADPELRRRPSTDDHHA